jgi:hypothetical protein
MPWGRIDDSLYDHRKLDLLADGRLEGVGLWAVAISWCNRHLTDGHVPTRQIERLGGTHDLAEQLVEVGLFDRSDGGYLVHDFLDFNDSKQDVLARREKEAQRKAVWRKTRMSQRDTTPRPGGTQDPSTHDVPVGQAVSTDVPAGHTTGQMSRRDSRARDVARIPTRPDPTRPIDSLERGSAGAGEREDVQALLDRGWAKVTAKQRKVLDEVLARHDETGAAFAAEVIRATPADVDALAAVMDADRRWQETQRRRTDAEDARWQATKADERNGAESALSRIDEAVKAWTP